MTLQLERSAIETYFGMRWGSTTPIGYDGQAFDPIANSVRMTIKSGAVMQGSIGRIINRIDNIGLVTLTIYTEGGKGSATWRGYAETLMGLFFEKTISDTGGIITASSQAFIRFSPPEMGDNRHPYIGADFPDPPFHLTNVIAPFVRIEYR